MVPTLGVTHAKSRHHASTRAGLFWAVVLLLAAGPAAGEIILDWDFDHGALEDAGTTITEAQITLGPRTDIYLSRWIYVRASGMLGLDPEFRISNDHAAGYSLSSSHRYVYSYDQQEWLFFDNGENSSGYYRFWNDAPFVEDVVWLAYGLPYPLSMTDDHVEDVSSSPFVGPTPSSDSNLVIGLSNDGTLTDKGRIVPQHVIYGYTVSDPSVPGPKTVVVLTTGNHPNETTGSYTFQGMVDFILSPDARAAALRQQADFYVYPNCNPDGRWAGHARTSPENPWTDHNRHWNDPVGFTDIAVVTAAMQADTNSNADYFFDFHSYNRATEYGIWMYPEHVASPFTQALVSREPAIGIMTATVEDDGPGISRHWAHLPEGLNAEYTFTPEAGFIPGWQPERLFQLGRNYALALYDAIVIEGCDDITTSGIVTFADDFDAGTSGLSWDLLTSSDDYTADFAFDYGVHGIPPAPNCAEPTTIGVKFTVNNNDSLHQAAALSAYPMQQTFVDNYAFKFDMWINYGDGPSSTEFMTAGINHTATEVVWNENPDSDGYSFAVSGEGGASQDYRAYEGDAMFSVASGVYLAGSQNHTAALYQSLFPGPEFDTPGVPGRHWVEVEIRQLGGRIEWLLDGTLLAVVSGITVDSGNVMIGYLDPFDSIAAPAEENFIIYDNVRVEELPNQDCNDNLVPDACETLSPGDFDADTAVDLQDFAALLECLAGPSSPPAPPDPTCAHVCLAVFDFDADDDVDLVDFAAFQEAMTW